MNNTNKTSEKALSEPLHKAGVSGSAFKTVEELSKNKHLISEIVYDGNGTPFRYVNGNKIRQIDEKTAEDVRKNELINLYRMRKI